MKWADLLQREGLNVAVFPTGYGKTTAILHADLKNARVIHVLPLQAIVSQLAERLSANGFDVCYQMGLTVPGVCKSPFLAALYNVVTLDSFVLNLFGVPVFELFRDVWHSDVAWLLASYADIIIFDEYHLMVAPDGDGEDVVKVHTTVKFAVEALRKRRLARRVLILTATITPSMIASLNPDGVWIYAPEGHRYVDAVRRELGNGSRVHVVPPSDKFGEEMQKKLKGVEFKDVNSKSGCGGKVKYPDLGHLVNSGVYVAVNSWRRATLLWEDLQEASMSNFSKPASILLLHAKLDVDSRRELTKRLGEGGALVATQVVEAGVDVSFKKLLTEPAPAFSIIQRTGRVARRPESPPGGEVIVLRTDYEAWRGVYDGDLTRKTEKLLEQHDNINWKVPVNNGYDYLQLILDLDDAVGRKIGERDRDVEAFLEYLDRYVGKPGDALRWLDKRGGSLLRSSTLFTGVYDGRVFVLDVYTLSRLGDRLKIKKRDGEGVVDVEKLKERPLETIKRLQLQEVYVTNVKMLTMGGLQTYTLDPCI